MTGEIILLIVGLVIGFFIAKWILSKQKWGDKESALIAKIDLKHQQELQDLKNQFIASEKIIKTNSVSGARRSLIGKFIEKFVPFLSNVSYEPSDMHFIGAPIDYIIFEGLHEDNIQGVTFLEVKTGKSRLTKREESLKQAILSRRVSWKEVIIPIENGAIPGLENEETSIRGLYDQIDSKLEK